MLAKLITYGKTREEAIQLMIEAIDNYIVEGIFTTLPFGKFVFQHEAFKSGNFDTHFVKKYYSPEKLKKEIEEEAQLAAIIGLKMYLEEQKILKIANN
jgi:propionyl-CoA carboxylase alpha chain